MYGHISAALSLAQSSFVLLCYLSAMATSCWSVPAALCCAVLHGYEVVVRSLARLGVRLMFGVIGIPVTPLASAAQAAGIRFISLRNEQAAGYAAAAAGGRASLECSAMPAVMMHHCHGLMGYDVVTPILWVSSRFGNSGAVGLPHHCC
jgi:hypothetical protein